MKFNKIFFSLCIFFTLLLFLKGLQFISPGQIDKNEKLKYNYNYKSSKYIDPQSSSISSGSLNIVILGLDGDEVRSDTIIFLNLNKDTGGLNILSIPRDTRVETKKGYGKINSLIGTGGEKLVCKKVAELTGLPVDFFVTLNYDGFKQIIDLLGGVEIYVKKNMDYDDAYQNLHIHFKKGSALLNGEMAERYVRYRKGNKHNVGYKYGDLTRMEVQQDFIISVIKQKAKLRYLQKLDDVFLVLKQNIKTDIEINDVDLFINIIKKVKSEEIKTYTLPGESKYIKNVWYYVEDNAATKLIIDNNFYK